MLWWPCIRLRRRTTVLRNTIWQCCQIWLFEAIWATFRTSWGSILGPLWNLATFLVIFKNCHKNRFKDVFGVIFTFKSFEVLVSFFIILGGLWCGPFEILELLWWRSFGVFKKNSKFLAALLFGMIVLVPCLQCYQIWQFVAILAIFQHIRVIFLLPKLPEILATFMAIFKFSKKVYISYV